MQKLIMSENTDQHRQFKESLSEQVNTVQQEARMVLPGIQTLFGFQLVAVFNGGFSTLLSPNEQRIHLAALLLIAISSVLVVAPAAYHRQAKHQISKHFVALSSRLLAWAMLPLAFGTCLDVFLVTRMILHSHIWSFIVAGSFAAFYGWTWFIFPRMHGQEIEQLPVAQLPDPAISADAL